MRLSIIIPAYNAARHIDKALNSVIAGLDPDLAREVEVIVIDDGSDDRVALEQAMARFSNVQLIQHESNHGMCAARNSGIASSHGDFVTLLDADDEFVENWFSVFLKIIAEWPDSARVCYTPCIDDAGELTCAQRDYRGWLTAEDMVLERLSGEYNPVFRGDYIRAHAYDDLGIRKSCGLMSYLRMAREAPFWITDKVMRRYHDAVEQSVTRNWTQRDKAAETHHCFTSVLAMHGDFIQRASPGKYLQMRQKLLIYKMLSHQGRDFTGWWQTRSPQLSWFATLALLLIGPALSAQVLILAKRWRFLRRYG
ncbi:MAG: glycosyltransferase family 2 protein [Azoarcus sp.]|jgi:glycosyltransferase involved in cell wall biosynthesis|nr:glycosyltransferase family 2 protein [Azoarcus sp.]